MLDSNPRQSCQLRNNPYIVIVHGKYIASISCLVLLYLGNHATHYLGRSAEPQNMLAVEFHDKKDGKNYATVPRCSSLCLSI